MQGRKMSVSECLWVYRYGLGAIDNVFWTCEISQWVASGSASTSSSPFGSITISCDSIWTADRQITQKHTDSTDRQEKKKVKGRNKTDEKKEIEINKIPKIPIKVFSISPGAWLCLVVLAMMLVGRKYSHLKTQPLQILMLVLTGSISNFFPGIVCCICVARAFHVFHVLVVRTVQRMLRED